jgi:toxin FitB
VRKQNKAKALEIEAWLDQLESSHNVLPMDAPCFRARLMEGKAEHLLEDAMIAATARVHDLKVVIRLPTSRR